MSETSEKSEATSRVVDFRSSAIAGQAAAIAENICEVVVESSNVTFIGDPSDVHAALYELHQSGIEGTLIS